MPFFSILILQCWSDEFQQMLVARLTEPSPYCLIWHLVCDGVPGGICKLISSYIPWTRIVPPRAAWLIYRSPILHRMKLIICMSLKLDCFNLFTFLHLCQGDVSLCVYICTLPREVVTLLYPGEKGMKIWKPIDGERSAHLKVMNTSLFPTGIRTVWPSSIPAGTGTDTWDCC